MTEAFSTTCRIHIIIEDCEGWWLCVVVVAQWQSTGCKSQVQLLHGFDSRQLPAFSLSSIFISKHLNSLYFNVRLLKHTEWSNGKMGNSTSSLKSES